MLAFPARDGGVDVGTLLEYDDHRHLRVRGERAGHGSGKHEDRQGSDEERNRPSWDAHGPPSNPPWATWCVAVGRPAARIPPASATIPRRDTACSPPPRRRHRHRRQSGPAVRLRLARGRAARRDVLLGQRRGEAGRREHPGRARARRTRRHRGGARARGAAGPRPGDDARDPRAARDRLRGAATAAAPGLGAARRRRHRRDRAEHVPGR